MKVISELKFAIEDASAKLKQMLTKYHNPMIAYSGGSDSDIMLHFVNTLNGYNLPVVFFDTGIEYQATLDHIQKQKHFIEVVKSVPVPITVKKYGQPFISKQVSTWLKILQTNNFDFHNDGFKSYDYLSKKYGLTGTLRFWCNENSNQFNIARNKHLKEFIIENPPTFNISPQCCDKSKKQPGKMYAKEHNIDLMLLGVRRSEGGVRAYTLKTCVVNETKDTHYAKYFPLFWWNNAVKSEYQKLYNIQYSDCYTVYKYTRTGCAGCPFGIQNEKDVLTRLSQFEPKLYKAVCTIFRDSYEYTQMYNDFRNLTRQ